MASLRDIRRRIRSVQNTQQITKAMEMVAAAKLRRAQTRLEAARPYGHHMKEMLENLSAAAADLNHPLFETRPVQNRALVLVTSDKGLAGSYNAQTIRRAEAYLKSEEGKGTSLITIGRKGGEYFRRRDVQILRHYQELGDQIDFAKAQSLSHDIIDLFLDGTVDEIQVLGTRFISAMSRSIVLETYLPIEPPAGKTDAVNYIFEPDPAAIFETLLPRVVANRMLMYLLEASASEHGARMVAMGSASKNAKEMIGKLTLVMNRARQAAITKEISEIVGGAEALK
jgi:F-type H+-transporting ATPase subunit gamma